MRCSALGHRGTRSVPAGVNYFSYCRGNPATAVDPTGLDDHHWFPQELLDLLEAKCGRVFKSFNVTARQVIDHFTTPVPGSGKGTVHNWIHNEDPKGKYNERAREIYRRSPDCCSLVSGIAELILESAADVVTLFYPGPEPSNPTFPYFKYFRDKNWDPTISFDLPAMIYAICNPKCPRPRRRPETLITTYPFVKDISIPDRYSLPKEQLDYWSQRPPRIIPDDNWFIPAMTIVAIGVIGVTLAPEAGVAGGAVFGATEALPVIYSIGRAAGPIATGGGRTAAGLIPIYWNSDRCD